VRIKFPIDVEGAEYVFFPAVSDYLLEPDTLMGNAAVMHVTGGSWTIGTENFDGINYGLFYSDRLMERIVKNVVTEVDRLGGKKVLVGECGHATRCAWAIPTFGGEGSPPAVNFLQYTHEQLKKGKIPLKQEFIEERVTYHDPCNLANYCCGGGGGFLQSGYADERRAYGGLKADQILATGAAYAITPCHNCHAQVHDLSEICDHPWQTVHLWTLLCLSLGILGPNEREYLGDDLKDVDVFHP